MSASVLARIYKDHKITFKYIRRIKKVIDFNVEYYRNILFTMSDKLVQAKFESLKIIYCDEAVFTFNTFCKKSWSPPYLNISVYE